MVINIVGAQALTHELRQEEILFVSGVIRTDHAELRAARLGFAELGRDHFESLRPGNWLKAFFGLHHRRLQSLGMLGEVECVAALYTQELVVNAAAVAIIPANDLVVADA